MNTCEIAQLIPSAVISFTALLATWYYSRASKNRENDKMMKELFIEFNARYDKLNNKLENFVNNINQENSELGEQIGTKADVIDYFNLCAEQYFWHKKKRIDKKIWASWNAGMNYWYNFDSIKELWEKEISNKNGKLSYYIQNGDEFFKNDN
jgi:hypothetical protein